MCFPCFCRASHVQSEANIQELECATREDFHASRLFLDDHRFYLGGAQCHRVNAAMARIDALPHTMMIYWKVAPFAQDPLLSDDYLY